MSALNRVAKDTLKGAALAELAGLTAAVVNGDSSATDITVTGVKVGDTIESVVMFASGVPSIVTDEVSITADDTIQLDTTDSTGNTLLVRFWPAKG